MKPCLVCWQPVQHLQAPVIWPQTNCRRMCTGRKEGSFKPSSKTQRGDAGGGGGGTEWRSERGRRSKGFSFALSHHWKATGVNYSRVNVILRRGFNLIKRWWDFPEVACILSTHRSRLITGDRSPVAHRLLAGGIVFSGPRRLVESLDSFSAASLVTDAGL